VSRQSRTGAGFIESKARRMLSEAATRNESPTH